MNNTLLDIFQAVHGLEAENRHSWYSSHDVPESVMQEVEELLHYDGLAEDEDFLAQRISNEERITLIGKSIGPYEVIRLIGHGGMGSVYYAKRFKPYEQEVALKVADIRLRSGCPFPRYGRTLVANLTELPSEDGRRKTCVIR